MYHRFPEPTLKPGDYEPNSRGGGGRGGYNGGGGRDGYQPRLGFNRDNDHRRNGDATVANRMIQ